MENSLAVVSSLFKQFANFEAAVEWGKELNKPRKRKKRSDGLSPSPGAKGILVLASKNGEKTFFRHVQTLREAYWLQNKMASEGWLCTIPHTIPASKAHKPTFKGR